MPQPTRRQTARGIALAIVAPAALPPMEISVPAKTAPRLTCFIRYQIDPFQREAFRAYAEAWGSIIPRCGGWLIGYFLPEEGTNDVAYGLIGFEGLGAYAAYRARLREDAEALANFRMAQQKRLILREERTFLETAAPTFELPART